MINVLNEIEINIADSYLQIKLIQKQKANCSNANTNPNVISYIAFLKKLFLCTVRDNSAR